MNPKLKAKIERFLKTAKTDEASAVEDFVSAVSEMYRQQVKDQLGNELHAVTKSLSSIEKQQRTIIDLLRQKLDLQPQEKRVLDLLEELAKRDLQ